MKKLLALLYLIPCALWGADSTIGNLTTNSAAASYRFVMENPGVVDYGITFDCLTNQILAGMASTAYANSVTNGYPWTNIPSALAANVITQYYSGNTPFFVSNSIVIAQTNNNSGLYVTNGALYVVATNGNTTMSGQLTAANVSATVNNSSFARVRISSGSAADAALSYSLGTSSGIYFPTTTNVAVTAGGAEQIRFGNAAATMGGSLTATNGIVQMVKGSFSTNFTCTTNLQFYLCNGTNQIVTLPNAANVTNVIYRFSTTNGYSKLIITNATGAQTVRDGTSLSYTNIGVAEVGFVSDGANWWLASRGKLVQPVAQFSCTTNIPMTSANTAYPVTFNSVDFDFSQGIVLANGTNGSASKMWITNSGIYEFDPSIVVNFSGNNTVTIWFRKDGANVANSATAIKGAAGGSIRCVTIPFVVTVTAPTAYEIWTLSTSTGDSFSFQAAGGSPPDDFPLSPSVICPVKRISDTWP